MGCLWSFNIAYSKASVSKRFSNNFSSIPALLLISKACGQKLDKDLSNKGMFFTTTSKVTYPYGDLLEPQYDQSTYLGRLKHFIDITNPVNLFTSNDTQALAKKKVLEYQQGIVDNTMTKKQYWDFANLYKATYHPDTNEKIILPFRMVIYSLM